WAPPRRMEHTPPIRFQPVRGRPMADTHCDVLIVDDQSPVRQMVRMLLHRFGLTFDMAVDGNDALAKLGETNPRVMITDVNMPHRMGLELHKRVRPGQSKAARDLPVLILTGHGDAAIVATALALDVSGFVVKPASPAGLKARLDRVFERHAV